MLAKYSINQRLYALMAIMAIAILTVSALSVAGLRFSSNSLESLHNAVTSSEQVTLITNRVQDRFVGELNNLRAGVTTWVDTDARIKDYQGQFTNDLALLVQASQASQMNSDALQKSGEMVQAAIAEFIGLGSNQSRADLELFLLNDLQPLVNPFIQSAQDLSTSLAVSANQRFTSTQSSLTQIMLIAAAVILLALLGTLTLSLFISRSIQLPLQVLNRTVEAVKANNNDVRHLVLKHSAPAAMCCTGRTSVAAVRDHRIAVDVVSVRRRRITAARHRRWLTTTGGESRL